MYLLVLFLQLCQRLLLNLLARVGPVHEEKPLALLFSFLCLLASLVHDGQDRGLLSVPHLVTQPEPLILSRGHLLLFLKSLIPTHS